ncbi:MAG: pyridoxamine 5'-phosphate oxidase family protein [Cyclobacteriaceae bacterium]
MFIMLLIVSFKPYAQQTDDGELESVARAIMTDVRYAGLTTIDSLGYPNTRTMDALPPSEDFEVWLATNPSSRKVQQIQENGSVALYYPQSEKGNYVTLIGKARLINDPESKAEHWREDWAEFYPTKQDMILIKVEPIRLEVVSYEHGIISKSKDWKAPEVNINTK